MAATSAKSSEESSYPGKSLGLPEQGRGSLAGWGSRAGALVLDWGLSMVVAITAFGSGVLTGGGWRSWTILAVFFAQTAVMGSLAGGSVGQLISRLAVVRLDRMPLNPGLSVLRAALVCLVIPALVIGPDRRGLHDLVAGTVVVRRR